jgi:Tfp pilus assembly ATPase PilU
VTVQFYAPAIRDAIRRGDLQDMKSVLQQAKQMRREQGELDKAIERLETAIEKAKAKG